MDPLGDQDPVAGNRPGRRDLIPRHYLGTIALADALTKACHSASCSAEGVGGTIAMAVASLTPKACWPSNLVLSQLRIIAQVLSGHRPQPPQQEPEP